jgi:3-oxoacyl-[acyl-carrier-protein] synthase-3
LKKFQPHFKMNMSTKSNIGILSMGHYLPENCIDNTYFVDQGLDTTPEWIESRSGIRTRYIALSDQKTSTLASRAAEMAIFKSGIPIDHIDFIILATATPDFYGFPSTACVVQKNLMFNRAIEAFDISAACSGFAYALSLAYSKIHSGLGKYGLVIGAETLSRAVNWADRRTCILFGDGAGAAVIGPVKSGGITGFNQGADGEYAGILTCDPTPTSVQFSGQPHPMNTPIIHMDGKAVFKKGVQVVSESIQKLMSDHHLTADSIDHVVCHQANQRILASVANQTGIPLTKFLMNIDRVGNTSAASIPLVLSEAVQNGTLHSGQRIILAGFGSGFTWSSVLLEWS